MSSSMSPARQVWRSVGEIANDIKSTENLCNVIALLFTCNAKFPRSLFGCDDVKRGVHMPNVYHWFVWFVCTRYG